jgi:hypothetical protein
VTAVREAFRSARSSQTPVVSKSSKAPAPKARASSEIDQLAAKLIEEILASPGSTMATLAPRVGATVRALYCPAKRLASAGRIKTTGARNETRYFPMGRAEAL